MSFQPLFIVQTRTRNYFDQFDVSMQGELLASVAADIMRGDFYCDEIIGVYRVALGETVTDVTDEVITDLVRRVREGEQPSEPAKKLLMRDVRGMAA